MLTVSYLEESWDALCKAGLQQNFNKGCCWDFLLVVSLHKHPSFPQVPAAPSSTIWFDSRIDSNFVFSYEVYRYVPPKLYLSRTSHRVHVYWVFFILPVHLLNAYLIKEMMYQITRWVSFSFMVFFCFTCFKLLRLVLSPQPLRVKWPLEHWLFSRNHFGEYFCVTDTEVSYSVNSVNICIVDLSHPS